MSSVLRGGDLKPGPYRKIGNCQVNHFAVLVRTGRLNQAVEFFTDQLNWVEDGAAKVSGNWGTARFVVPYRGPLVRIQLSELRDGAESVLPGVHLSLGFDDPKRAAFEVSGTMRCLGFECSVEEVPGGKFFVSLPGIFNVDFEFVPLRQ